MRMQLAGWCVLLAVGSTLAADKPKKKEKPTTPPPVVEEFARPTEASNNSAPPSNTERGTLSGAGIGSVAGAIIGEATGNPKTGAVVGPIGGGVVGSLVGADADKPAQKGFTVTKPVGVWEREVKVGETKHSLRLTVTGDRLRLRVETEYGVARLDADYSINKESVLFGVIDTFEVTQAKSPDPSALSNLSGQPFAVRFRVDGDELTLKEFKGLGIGKGDSSEKAFAEEVAAVCGRYTLQKTAAEPMKRQAELLNQSETHGLPGVHTPPRPVTPPGHLTPSRIHGGILKADPPKEEAKDSKTLVLPPLKKGETPTCDVPSDAEVLRVFHERREKEVGKLAEKDVVIVKNQVTDKIDPFRFYPLVGMANLHRCTWECGVYYEVGGRKKVEVITLNKDHLHLYVGENPDAQRESVLEMTKWK
jgi:outer membrane lipoprotein SlyB